MKFRNPFKRRKTVAELIEEVRPIVQAYGIPEAYVSYEFRHDYLTDRPPWIILKYPLVPELSNGRNEDFKDELNERFGDTVTPFAIRTDNDNLDLARACGIPVLP